jgi:hypothetical protein
MFEALDDLKPNEGYVLAVEKARGEKLVKRAIEDGMSACDLS